MTNAELDAIEARFLDGVVRECLANKCRFCQTNRDGKALIDEVHQLWAQVGSLGALLRLSEAEVVRLQGLLDALDAAEKS